MELPNCSILKLTPNLAECLLEYSVFNINENIPFQFSTIIGYQQHDQTITNLATTQPDKYTTKTLGSNKIIILCHNEQQIVILNEMLEKSVHWYHLSTAHNLGSTRLHATLKQHFFHPKLASKVHQQIEHCDVCQHMKRGSHQYGELVPRDVHATPWQTVVVDCIGPWVIKLCGGTEIKLLTLTSIGVSTNLLEIDYLSTKTFSECADGFENGWLSRYP